MTASMQTHFPTGMYDILAEAETNGHAHIVSWCNDGLSFKIHKPDQMLEVLNIYFSQTKYKSFVRQLQVWGFIRITKGENKNTCFHKLLVQGKRFLCLNMKRKERKPKSSTSSSRATTTSTNSVPMMRRGNYQEQLLREHLQIGHNVAYGNNSNNMSNHRPLPIRNPSASSSEFKRAHHMPLAPTAKSAIAQDFISDVISNNNNDGTIFLSSLHLGAEDDKDENEDWLKNITYEGPDIILEPDKFAETSPLDLPYSDTDTDLTSVVSPKCVLDPFTFEVTPTKLIYLNNY